VRTLALALTTGCAALVVAGCSPHAESPSSSATPTVTVSNVTLTTAQLQKIQIATVATAKYHKVVDTTGTVDFDNDQATEILAPMSGPVTKLLVSLGDQVKAGQPLAEVDSPDFATAISTYRKALATAKIDRELADQDQQLIDHKGISLREAEQAKIDATNAEADSEAALQGLVSLQVDPDVIKAIQDGKAATTVRAIFRSPIAGTVVDRSISPGELLQAGSTTCFTIADLSRMWVMANLFGAQLGSVSLGDSAEIVTDVVNTNLTGKVDNISSVFDPDTRSVAVRVVADNPGGILKKDMYVRVLIRAQQESSGLLAPVSAVLRNDENLPFVYLAQADGSFQRHGIDLGNRVGDQFEITSGLKEGDRMVVDGGLFVQFLQDQ
jgi:cobalt-zinc-cadmium efflux system membrane fusion protein